MGDPINTRAVFETQPKPEEVRLLEDMLYAFNVEATGVADGEYLALFLRDARGAATGGVFGWTWGDTCYVRSLYIPADMRKQGLGTRLMAAVETEAKARKCRQIVLQTHDFQAPGFYLRLGFAVTGSVADYPRGHQLLTMVKPLPQ